MMPDIHIEPGSREWYGLRGARQRVRQLVERMVEQNQLWQAEQDRATTERFRDTWQRTNELFAPPTDMRSMHKRLHLPIGSPEPMQPIEQVDPEPHAAESIPDDYMPSTEPVPGTEISKPEEMP